MASGVVSEVSVFVKVVMELLRVLSRVLLSSIIILAVAWVRIIGSFICVIMVPILVGTLPRRKR